MSEVMFELKLTATAEVRDKDGNLISNDPVEMTSVVTDEQARAIVAAQDKGEI